VGAREGRTVEAACLCDRVMSRPVTALERCEAHGRQSPLTPLCQRGESWVPGWGILMDALSGAHPGRCPSFLTPYSTKVATDPEKRNRGIAVYLGFRYLGENSCNGACGSCPNCLIRITKGLFQLRNHVTPSHSPQATSGGNPGPGSWIM